MGTHQQRRAPVGILLGCQVALDRRHRQRRRARQLRLGVHLDRRAALLPEERRGAARLRTKRTRNGGLPNDLGYIYLYIYIFVHIDRWIHT